ncbi:hypothetical protein V1477_002184 [Vespula maculifrons]|uniref:Uncharacterized protein n=1 Tax=Vespula maculifrons TaxID=7453 RepID=A0ABD2CVS4_VESMC
MVEHMLHYLIGHITPSVSFVIIFEAVGFYLAVNSRNGLAWQGVDFGTNHIALRGEVSTYFAWIMDSLGFNPRCPFDQQMFIPLASLLIVERKRVHVLVISAKSLYYFAFVDSMLSLKYLMPRLS